MQWLSPWWLAAAAAVIVPIVLHLRDQQPPHVVRVGSVADLSSTPASRRRRHLDDIPLLLLRCAVMVLGAIWLAGPQLSERGGAGQRVAVVPGSMPMLRDSLEGAGVRVADLAQSEHPWTLAAWADTALARADTILLVAPAIARYAGARPRVAHATELLAPADGRADTSSTAPPTAQREPLSTTGDPARRTRDARSLVWWSLLAVIVIERLYAYRRQW